MAHFMECPCSKLTGQCRHDCPACGGEGITRADHPDCPSALTPAEINAALKRGAEDVKYLKAQLDRVFRQPPSIIILD